MSYRDDALRALDVRAFYAQQGVEMGAQVGPNEYRFACVFHDDREPSANVNLVTGLWHCHTENRGGGPIDFLMEKGMKVREAIDAIGASSGMPPSSYGSNGKAPAAVAAPVKVSKLTEANVEAWHEAALRNVDLMRWFAEKRGFTEETVRAWKLGWDSQRVTIPIRDDAAKLVNVRRYMRDSSGEAGKMLSIAAGEGAARLWPLPLVEGPVLMVEGEWDMILARQMGFPTAVTVTSGAGIFKPEWTKLFAGHEAIVCYDNDDAGRRGAQRVANFLAPVTNTFILQVPGLPPKGDITDFFVEQGRTADELRALIADATPVVVSTTAAIEPDDAERVPLHLASGARYQGKRLAIPVLLSGKAMTPYTVPSKANVHCDMTNKRFCGICPLAESQGSKDVALTAMDPAALSLIDVSDEGRYKAMKQLAGAVVQCSRPQVDVAEWANIEELRVIPEIDSSSTAGETEYVARQAFLIGHGTMPNRAYEMRGYTHASPKSQATVHLFSEAIPAQDNIHSFAVTPDLHRELREMFAERGGEGVEARWLDIYADYAATVHRIQGRFDMQVAYDLVWHSVIAFNFNGAFVRRGWVECMVIGDSGQGKTEMAMNLLRHYRLGERVQGEQSSAAGLIGGLEKMGDTWLLSWGRIPLNDRRLLIIDEAQGLASAQIEGMSDVRATGVAEITKIRTERTNARTRIVWLANPVSGLTISQHNQGVLAIKELFKKPEDIRRLDLAIIVASGDVDFARAINVRHASATEPRYTSEASRALVLWAWSRRPEQVVFTPDATDEILRAATEMGRQYHASIPLVEPSDQRLKLARLAAAAAARVYSTDETGELLIVRIEHVRFVVAYLHRIYNSRGMSYGEYSNQQRRGETLTDDEKRAAFVTIDAWSHSADAVTFFRQSQVFKRAELEEVVGWTAEQSKSELRFLASARLVRGTRNGYVKTAAFITLLREITGEPVADETLDEPQEGDAF